MAAAGFGLNFRHANVRDDQLNHARWQEPDSGSGSSLIACRICDRVFVSSKALFDHIELHLSLDESAARWRLLLSHFSLTSSSQRSQRLIQNSPLLAAGITTGQVLQQRPMLLSSTLRNPLSLGTKSRNLGPLPTASLAVSFRPSGNKSLLLQPRPTLQVSAAPQTITVPLPQPPTDCFTRPFLNQLEATLLVDGMASVMDRDIAAGKLNDQQMLDVTLKLGREDQD